MKNLITVQLPWVMAMLFTSVQYYAFGQMSTLQFSFDFDSLTYNGIVDLPVHKNPSSMVMIIPSEAQPDLVRLNSFYGFRVFLVNQGFGVCVWEKNKMANVSQVNEKQNIARRADVATAAIAELRRNAIPGSAKIGLWGLGKAGLVCPLIIQQNPDIAFWISVSGLNELDNSRYLIKSNLKAEGKSESKINLLMKEWDFLNRYKRGGKSYTEVKAATKNLFEEQFYVSVNGGGIATQSEFGKLQQMYQANEIEFDENTGLQVLFPGIRNALNQVECPVLAFFGRQDTQVNWRKTLKLYQDTLGKNPKATLSIKILSYCNHNMQKCVTGGMFEDLEEFGWQACDGYAQTMVQWFQKNGLSNKL